MNKKKNKAFTLLELLVAVSVFSLIVGGASGFFISALQAQRRALSNQELLSQGSYLIEYMSRAIRMAKKDIDGNCIGQKSNYQITSNSIKFMNYKGECQEFYLEEGMIKERKEGIVSPLTSSDLEVLSFNIDSSGISQEDLEQPRVFFSLHLKRKAEKPELISEIYLQTTISQRNFDIQY